MMFDGLMEDPPQELLLDRMVRAVQRVWDRLSRATRTLERAGIAHAVAGNCAAYLWVARADPAAVRNAKTVSLLLRRSDMNDASRALVAAGFVQRHFKGDSIFLDGPDAADRHAVHIIMSCEKIRPGDLLPAPDVNESEQFDSCRVVSLEAMVRMNLTAFRAANQMELRDLLDVGLIDDTWCSRFIPELGARLRQIIDTPEG